MEHKFYFPQDPLGEMLIKSIITKTALWLHNLEQEQTGEYGLLEWNFDPQGGAITFGIFDETDYICIAWAGPAAEPVAPAMTDPRIERAALNLQYFTEIEKSIYDALAAFEKDLEPDHQVTVAEVAAMQGLKFETGYVQLIENQYSQEQLMEMFDKHKPDDWVDDGDLHSSP
jgi:hypothetical protein